MKLSFLKHMNKAQHLLCFFLISCCSFGQVDSLLQLVNDKKDTAAINIRLALFEAYFTTDLDKGKAHLDTASQLPAINDFPEGQARLKEYYGEYYTSKGDFKQANIQLMESLKIYTQLKDIQGITSCWNNLGIVASEQGNLERGLKCFIKTKRLYHKAGDKSGEARMSINIGQVNKLLGKPNTAEKYIKEGLEISLKNNDQRTIMKAYHMLSGIYVKKNQFKKAINTIEKEKQIAIQLNDLYQLTTIEHTLGTYYYDMGELDSAKVYYKKALHAYTKYGAVQGQAMIMLNLGGLEMRLQNNDSALYYASEGVKTAEKIKAYKQITEGYDLLMHIHQASKNYEQALICSQRYNKLNDSIIGVDTRNKINELSLSFETKEKENEIELLSEQDTIKSFKIRQQNYLITTLAICLLLIIGITIFYIRYRKTQAGMKQVELEQRALRSQMNPHFIFNSLNSIHRMFMEGDFDVANDYISDFGELLRTILENSGKSVIPINDEINTIKLYLEIEKMRTEGMIEYNLNVDPTIDLYNSFVPPLIIQPFVENAIWHGILPTEKKGTITIDIARRDKNTLICTITDNGIGIEQSKKQKKTEDHKSKGMKITEDRLNIVNSVKAEELLTGGTKITILIPVS